jgi:hypothetical protein
MSGVTGQHPPPSRDQTCAWSQSTDVVPARLHGGAPSTQAGEWDVSSKPSPVPPALSESSQGGLSAPMAQYPSGPAGQARDQAAGNGIHRLTRLAFLLARRPLDRAIEVVVGGARGLVTLVDCRADLVIVDAGGVAGRVHPRHVSVLFGIHDDLPQRV